MNLGAREELLRFIDSRPEPGFADQLETEAELAQFTSETGPEALQETRRLRDALVGLLLPSHHAEASLDDLIDRYDLRPRVEPGAPLSYVVCSPSAVPILAGRMLTAAIELHVSGEAHHLKVCQADNCVVPFIDTSPTQRRDYCCPKCATRMRVRRHRG